MKLTHFLLVVGVCGLGGAWYANTDRTAPRKPRVTETETARPQALVLAPSASDERADETQTLLVTSTVSPPEVEDDDVD